MGQAIPTQHPAVVLRSHYNHLRALLAAALIALVGLTAAIVTLATDEGARTSPTPAATAAEFRLPSHARIHGGAAVPDPSVPGRDLPVAPGTRYDGGPDEGTRGPRAEPARAGTRYDGGPDEGTSGPGR